MILAVLALVIGILVWRSWAKFAVRSVAKQQEQMGDLVTAAAYGREALQERLAQREYDNRRLPKTTLQKLVFNDNAFKNDVSRPAKNSGSGLSDFEQWRNNQ